MQMNNNNNNSKKNKNVPEETKMGKVKQDFSNLVDTVEKRIKELDEKERHWATLAASMEEHASKVADKVTLDIGKNKQNIFVNIF
jgi:alkylhydroperoxidase/carboxymuconolactone decarboxylase family protein YurZ